jgi:hypothetical protein
MFAGFFTIWNRSMEAQRMMTETLSSAASVVSHRGKTISDAIENPMAADYGELAQMIAEKVAAMTESGNAVMADWAKWQNLWSAHSTSMLGAFSAANSSFVATQRLVKSGERLSSQAVSSAIRVLAPIHRRATANERRLSHKR